MLAFMLHPCFLLPIFLLCIEILIHKINKIIDVLFQSGKMKAETK